MKAQISACAVLTLIAGLGWAQLEDDNPSPNGRAPGKWMTLKPTAKSDKTWLAIKAEADDAIANLKRDSAPNRKAKFIKLAKAASQAEPRTRDVYRLARYDLVFHDEIKATEWAGAVPVSLENCYGSSDIEFMRVAYTVACLNGVSGDWKDLGFVLLTRFPKDVPLKMAIVRDCWQGRKETWPQIEKAMAINEELARNNQWPAGTNIHAHRASLWRNAYLVTKRKSHLENGIRFTEINLKQLTNPDRIEIAQGWLDEFKGYLRDKKYVPG